MRYGGGMVQTAKRLRRWQLAAAGGICVPAVVYAAVMGGQGEHMLLPLAVGLGTISTSAQAASVRQASFLSVAWPALWWPLLYSASVDAAEVAPDRFVDPYLARLDARFLRLGPDRMPAWALGGAWEEVANVFYISFYAVIPLALAWAWLRRGEVAALRFGLGLLATLAACSTLWLAFPAGGYHSTGSPTSAAWGPATAIARAVYATHPHYAAAFPSSHVALSVSTAALLGLHGAGWGWLAWALGVSFATVYGQYHYLVDVPPGWAVGLAVAAAVWWVSPVSGDHAPPG